MSSVNKVRSADTLTPWGHYWNGGFASGLMLVLMQPVDGAVTAIMTKQRLALGGLYAGLGANMAGVVPVMAISNVVNEGVKKRLVRNGKPTEGQEMLATAVATVTSTLAATPFEVAKVRQQTAAGAAAKAVTPIEVAKARLQGDKRPKAPPARVVVADIFRKEGFRGLFRGYTPLTLRDLGVNYAMFQTADVFEKYVPAWIENRKARMGVAGVAAGALAGALTTPPAFLKTRMQADTTGKLRSTYTTAVEIVKKEGIGAFFDPKAVVGRTVFVGGAVGFIVVFKAVFPQFYPGVFHRDSED